MGWDAWAALAVVALAGAWLLRRGRQPGCARCPTAAAKPLELPPKTCACSAVPAERLSLGRQRQR